jgi:hypothetical protein
MRNLHPTLASLILVAPCLTMSGPATAGTVVSAGPAMADLVVNGGFETGDFTAWTLSGNTSNSGVDTIFPHSGLYAAFFGPVGSLGFLSQTLATTPGTTYELSFWLKNEGGPPNEFQVTFGDATLDRLDLPAFDYTRESLTSTATSTATLLQFGFRHTPGFFDLDDVSVIAVGVPEPSGLTLLGAGVAGLMAYAWWRRRVATFSWNAPR